MNFIEFQEKAAEGMQAFLGEDVQVKRSCVRKNNGVMLEGISITRANVNIAPTIYLNDFYREYGRGKSLSSIIRQIADIYEATKLQKNMDLEFFLDYEQVRTKLIYRLVNYDKNREWLEEIPHIPYLDMALTFQCLMLQDDMGNATIQITKEHCRIWNVDESELYRQAKNNTEKYLRPTITGMEEVVRDMITESLRGELKQSRLAADDSQEAQLAEQLAGQMLHTFQLGQEEQQMFVLSNHIRMHGAAVLLYSHVLKRFAEEKRQNFYILPSSVHEVILIPDSGKENPVKLRDMVQEVNMAEVDSQEQLSDSVYYYDRVSDVISLLEN